MRRFYTTVQVVGNDAGFSITLDGRALRTPAKAALTVPTRALAQAMADEWAQQGEDIDLATMPMTGFANAAIDVVALDPAAFATTLAAYAQTDLFCYRAPDAALAAEQAARWNPILTWAEQRWDINFRLTDGIMHIAQPDNVSARLSATVHALDPYTLAALSPLVTIGGSLVAALAAIERAFEPDALWSALMLDELWQEERWGAVDDAVDARAYKQAEWMAAVRFVDLLRTAD